MLQNHCNTLDYKLKDLYSEYYSVNYDLSFLTTKENEIV